MNARRLAAVTSTIAAIALGTACLPETEPPRDDAAPGDAADSEGERARRHHGATVGAGGSSFNGPDSCTDACGTNPGNCWCDAACLGYGDCCSDFVAVCDPYTCADHCGGFAGGCWCDDACQQYGDCCEDYVACLI